MSVPPTSSSPDRNRVRPKLVLVQPVEQAAPFELDEDGLPDGLVKLAGAWSQPRRGRPGRRRRALVIVTALPEEGDAAPGSALFNAVALRRLGFDVAMAPVDGELDRPGEVLARSGVASLGRPVHRSVEEVLQRQGDTLDLVLIGGAELACAYGPLVRLHGPAARLVCWLAGLVHPGLMRQASAERRHDLVPAARAAQRREMLAALGCDATVVPTEADAAVLRGAMPQIKVHAAGNDEGGVDGALRRAVEGQQRLRLAVP